MKPVLLSILNLGGKVVCSLSLLFWSFTLAAQLYTVVLRFSARDQGSLEYSETPYPSLIITLIAFAFIKLSWDGLTSFGKLKKHSMDLYLKHARGDAKS